MVSNNNEQKLVFITDPKVLAIPIRENNEALLDIKSQSIITYGPSPEIPDNQDYTYMRTTVYEKLVKAQILLPNNLRICLYEAYRSLQLQKMLFDNRYSKVAKLHPQWSHEQIFIETTRLVSPTVNVNGTINIPPHSTGAAIDVYLIDEQGEALDMGLHPKDWMDDVDGTLSLTHNDTISKQAKHNRQIMNHVLQSVGFANYPTEFWHWSYGDRYWAFQTKQSHAIYGTIENSTLRLSS